LEIIIGNMLSLSLDNIGMRENDSQ